MKTNPENSGSSGRSSGLGVISLQYLIVDIFALRCPARLQDVVVVTVVNDEDSTRFDHTGDILEGQLLVTLVPWELCNKSDLVLERNKSQWFYNFCWSIKNLTHTQKNVLKSDQVNYPSYLWNLVSGQMSCRGRLQHRSHLLVSEYLLAVSTS